jgi:hypothetical protein
LAGKNYNIGGKGCGCLFLIFIVLIIIGACTPKESPEEKAAKEAWLASQLAQAVPDETSSAAEYGALAYSGRQTIAATPAPTATPTKRVTVYPSTVNERLHPCEQRWATIPAPGYYICDFGPDGVLRWIDDKAASAAAAKAQNDAYWAEHRQEVYVPPAGSSVDNYTGPRCYNPGGETYRRC